MRIKNILLVSMILLAILTIGAASAGDDVDTLATDNATGEVLDAPSEDVDVLNYDSYEDYDYHDLEGSVYWNVPHDHCSDETFSYNVTTTRYDSGHYDFYISSYDDDDEYDLKYALVIDSDVKYNGTVNGQYEYKISNLEYGVHNWTASYSLYQSGKYCGGNSKQGTITVNYYGLKLPANSSSEVSLGAYFDGGVSGDVIISVDGVVKYTGKIGNKRSHVYTFPYVFPYGRHVYNITYSGDRNHKGFTKLGSFDSSYLFSLNLDDSSVGYGSKVSGTLYLDDKIATNNINISMSSGQIRFINHDWLYNYADFELEGMDIGENVITFAYEDATHPRKSITRIINVKGKITLSSSRVMFGDDAAVSITLPEDAKGYFHVYRMEFNSTDGQYHNVTLFNESLNGGKASYSFDTSRLGYNEFFAEYIGDDYEVKSVNGNFTVIPKVTVSYLMLTSNKRDILVQLPFNTQGNLTVSLLSDNSMKPMVVYNQSISSNMVPISTFSLGYGNYKIYVDYEGPDGSIHSKDPVKEFFIDYWLDDTDIEVTTNGLWFSKYGSESYLIGEFFFRIFDSKGRVYVYIDDEMVREIPLHGKDYNLIDVSGFPVGKHTWQVKYVDGEVYDSFTAAQGIFYVTYFSIPNSINCDEDLFIRLPEDAGGYVSVSFDGKAYDVLDVKNGGVSIDLGNLSLGSHPYVIKYSGDGRYVGETVTGTLETKGYLTADLHANLVESYYDDTRDYYIDYGKFNITIRCPEDATGNVKVSIDSKSPVSVKIINGIAQYANPDLALGHHTLQISYDDSKYSLKSVKYDFYISRDYKITSTVCDEMVYGDAETISVTLPSTATGNLIVKINNEEKTVKLNKGKASYSLKGLAAGYYNISARFEGSLLVDPLYLGQLDYDKCTFGEFRVLPRLDPSGELEVAVGSDKNITVNLQDISGQMRVSAERISAYGDKEAYEVISSTVIDLNGGNGKYTAESIPFGPVRYSFEYIGDARVPSTHVIITAKPKINITESADKSVNITFELPADGDGILTVVLENKSSISANISEGRGVICLKNLTIGENRFDVMYEGNYGNLKETLSAYVNGLNTTVKIVNVAFKGTAVSFDIVLSNNISGKLMVFIGANAIQKDVINGTVSVSANLDSWGQHKTIICYDGDDSYNEFRFTDFISVPKPKVTSTISSVAYLFERYSVTVCGFDGKPVQGATVVFTVDNKKMGSAKTDANGIAPIYISLEPKKYKITATVLGVKYTKTVEVRHVLTLKAVTVKKSAKKLVLQATLKNGKTAFSGEKITFKFNGKSYTAKTDSKGVAKVTINKNILKKLKVGKKVKYEAAFNKDAVKKSAKVKK